MGRNLVESDLGMKELNNPSIRLEMFEIVISPTYRLQVREGSTPHPRKKLKTGLGVMGFLWALEWGKK